jgi:hypothetical protein
MQKTRLGISVGLLGAAIYLTGLFSGYLVAVLLTGYVLLFEENEWLKRSAVKAVSLMAFFSFITVLVNLIPNVINCISYVASMFGSAFYARFISNLVSAVTSAIDIIEKILFIGLGIKALNQGTIAVPVVDKLISKYMG